MVGSTWHPPSSPTQQEQPLKRLLAAVRAAVCILSLLAAPLPQAQTADPAMHAALERLAASQNIEQNWQQMVRTVASEGARKVLQGTSEALDADPAFSPAQRTRGKQAAAEVAPQIAADVEAVEGKVDAKALMLRMMAAVYPKYYSVREIQEMAKFYDSPVFRKVSQLGIKAQGEISRTGANPALVWARYEARLTPEEKRLLAAFQNSPTGQKMHRLAPQVQQDSLGYLRSTIDGLLDEVMARYRTRLLAAMRAGARP
jgi:hypothetical protein